MSSILKVLRCQHAAVLPAVAEAMEAMETGQGRTAREKPPCMSMTGRPHQLQAI